MVKIGVVGASGFVGNRAVEILHAANTEVRSPNRSPASFERLTRQDIDCKVASKSSKC